MLDGGSYTLPLQELAPQQEKSFDIRLLRDGQVKDSIGRVIPSTVTSGQATWKAHGSPSLTGRLEVYNAGEATASSLSCSTTCCVSTVDTWCDPSSMSGLAGDTVTVNLLETLQQECDGRMLGPFVVTSQATWSSSNTAVISVGPVTTAGCQVSCLSAGTANAHADFDGISSILDITSGVCEGTFIPFPADCPIDVLPTVSVSGPTAVPLGTDVNTIQLTATGDPAGGTFVWSTTSSSVTLTNTDSATVTVKSVTESMSQNDVTIAVSYTLNTETASASSMLTVQKPTSLSIVAGTDSTTTESACMSGNLPGCGVTRTFRYQVRDKFGQPMLVDGMQIWDSVAITSNNGCNLASVATTCTKNNMTNSGPCGEVTFSGGQFNETISRCFPACRSNSGTCITGCTTIVNVTWNVNGISLSGDVKSQSDQCNKILVNGQ